uniref:Uncharacterized protein n=1 Tax=Peronospora matthiolae TaxID=2874970 RepID=A0AAV1T3I8_9STRA
MAAKAQAEFLASGDLISRLASNTAQPLVIDQALREATFALWIKVDFSESSPCAADILNHVYPAKPERDIAQDYASVYLFFCTQAARTYNDPYSRRGHGDRNPDCLVFSKFLLWSENMLHALCHTALP